MGVSEFFAMGGYAHFVWPAYGIVAVVLIALWIVSFRFVRSTERELEGLDVRRRDRTERVEDETQA